MKFVYWSRDKVLRLFIIACTVSSFIGLGIVNALEMFHTPGSFSVAWLAFFFGLSSFVAFVFLAVGSLVWLYAREKLVAQLLFVFSAIMMITFTSLANLNVSLILDDVASVGGIVALNLVSIILFYFPQNVFTVLEHHLPRYKPFLVCYLVFLSICAVICSLIQINAFGLYDSLGFCVLLYYVLGFITIVGIAVGSYIKLEAERKKQQMRIFVWGLILSLLPLFLLTIVPLILHLPGIDGAYTSLAAVIFPLALGYSVLRYQLLVLDTYIRRIVSFIVGSIALAILVYAEITCLHIFSHGNISILTVIFIGVSLAICAPLIWWLSRTFANQLLFPEVIRYNRILQEPSLVNEEILHVDDVARLLTTAAMDAFEVSQICVFVLDETSTSYQLSPIFSASELDSPCITLFRVLRRKLVPSPHNDEYQLDIRLPALQRLLYSRRPVLLSEILLSKEELPCALDLVMNTTPPLGQDDYLFVPLRSQGKMIGVLVLGERADHQPYAGPDLEVAQILTGRFSPILENARLYERVSKSYTRQKEVDALKEQFIMVASHELRTPLTIVQGYVELLCEHHDKLMPDVQADFLKKARVGCDELNLMVSNIVDTNMIDVDVSKIHLHPIVLDSTVLHVLEMLQAVIQSEERSIRTSIQSNLAVFADDLRLRQILLNLISNALKYSAPSTPIEISAVEENLEVEISIRDYGLGVPSEKQREIFEPFTRLERDLNSPVRGSGLGLYICEQFVNAMGGRISVESSGVPGEGSVFRFVLRCIPLDRPQPAQAVEMLAYP